MKIYYIFLLFLLTGPRFGYSQTQDRILIPVLKESKVIDSLMNIVLDPNTMPIIYNERKPFIGKWIAMFFDVNCDKRIDVELRTSSNFVINYDINGYMRRHLAFGYFKYKQYNVLVRFENNLPDFFSLSHGIVSFKYVYKLKQSQPIPTPLQITPPGVKIWFYDYIDNRFEKTKFISLR